MTRVNLIISETKSHQTRVQGMAVVVFATDSEDFERDIGELGFSRHLIKDRRTGFFTFYNQFFNAETGESVFYRNGEWTYADSQARVLCEKEENGSVCFDLAS